MNDLHEKWATARIAANRARHNLDEARALVSRYEGELRAHRRDMRALENEAHAKGATLTPTVLPNYPFGRFA